MVKYDEKQKAEKKSIPLKNYVQSEYLRFMIKSQIPRFRFFLLI